MNNKEKVCKSILDTFKQYDVQRLYLLKQAQTSTI